jgi:signal transduction histidine kinase/CheY-like chemotaxis protein
MERTDPIRSEQIRMLHRSAEVALAAALTGACVLCGSLLYIGAQTPAALALWMAWVLADFLLRQGLCFMVRRADLQGSRWRPWARRFTLATVFGGLVWGCGAVFLMTPDPTAQLVIMLFISATASGAVPAFGSHLPTTRAYIVCALLPFTLWSATRGDALHDSLALMGLVFMAVFLLLAERFNANLIESLRLRFLNVDLLADVQQQKDVAERASVAKSRFLASASHDLRQPVHALSLFVGALKGREMDAEARRLVAHLDDSIEALDSLFVALLDISRLDAGIVQTQVRPFALQPLLARVCEDHAAEARDKGIRLVQRPCAASVDSDPVLVERILRNIVGNAVRYTDRGGVLVGCRRRGPRLRIEVWDSGRGIPLDQQARVFEEFYQLGNPERDRAKGLGLGLAIVQRLATLLDCPLTLASVPGRGSVFTIALPLASTVPASEPAAEPAPLTSAAGLVLVIDDEVAIQEAMRSLLGKWGHEVVVAGSFEEMLARTAERTVRPNLIICDYRLRGDENGIEVIERLRSEFNHDIPAMLVTGDTAPDRLQEAERRGYVLLHKPLARGRLRAAIGNLMSSGGTDAPEP